MTGGGFSNKPKILKGAFVEFGLSLPPQFLVFQFNPEQLSRSKSASYSNGTTSSQSARPPRASQQEGGQTGTSDNQMLQRLCSGGERESLRDMHLNESDLLEIQKNQQVTFTEESISLQIRLDASEKLNDGEPIAGLFGILPELSALEQMVSPKDDTLLGALTNLFGSGDTGHQFLNPNENPPVILFIWGYTRVLPVNIESLSITETEFNSTLAPTRATVDVQMRVIEGKNIPYTAAKLLRGVQSTLNLRNLPDLVNVVVPG